MDETGYISFPGITTVEGGSYTLALGISPGVAVIQCRPQKQQPDKYGSLTIGLGNSTTITFPDCVLDSARMQVDESGQVVTAYVLDRRWKWRFPVVSGVFNQYKPSGDLDVTTEKTPRELASRCLDAMDETGYDVSALPDDLRPEINWDLVNAAEALQSLCDQLGCVVALGLDNKVRICVAGTGNTLPETDDISNVGYATDPAEKPSSIQVTGEPDVFCVDIKLYPLAREVTGELVDISDVSYIPTGNNIFAAYYFSDWGDTSDFTNIADEKARACAKESIGKYYGYGYIKGFFPRELNDPSYPIKGTTYSSKQIEWLPYQLYKDENGVERPPTVWGRFLGGKESLTANNVDVRLAYEEYDETSTDSRMIASKNLNPHTIDLDRHCVHFTQPQIVIGDGGVEYFADLYIRIAFRYRSFDGEYFRTYGEKAIANPVANPNAKTKPMIVHANGYTVRRIIEGCGPDGGKDNTKETLEAYQEIADLVAKQFETVDAKTVTYDSIHAIQLDGAIRSVSWSVGGGNVSQTTAMRNNETQRIMPTYRDRRFRQQSAAAVAGLKQLNNAIQQAAKLPLKDINLP